MSTGGEKLIVRLLAQISVLLMRSGFAGEVESERRGMHLLGSAFDVLAADVAEFLKK